MAVGRRGQLLILYAGWVERSDTHQAPCKPCKPCKRNAVLTCPMSLYRHNRVHGGTFFFTVNLAERKLSLLTEQLASLRLAFVQTRRRHPFSIDAIARLPDHMHAIWTMPEGDADYATRWRLIKTLFSRSLANTESVSKSRRAQGERGIWQRRYWEHTIRNEADLARHVDYIHINPVKHGLTGRVRDWAPSSFHHFVKSGVYPADWAGDSSRDNQPFGEMR